MKKATATLKLIGEIHTLSPVRIGAGSYENERERRNEIYADKELRTDEQRKSKYRLAWIDDLDKEANENIAEQKHLDGKENNSIIPIMKQYRQDIGKYVPVIPGASLKGAIKDYISWIAGNIWPDKYSEITNRLFGFLSEDGCAMKHSLWVGDVFFATDQINKKMIAPVDRYTRAVVTPLTELFIEPNSIGGIEIVIDGVTVADIALLALLIRDWEKKIRIGAAKARGYGVTKFVAKNITINSFSREDCAEFFRIKTLKWKNSPLGKYTTVTGDDQVILFKDCLEILRFESGEAKS